jgi:hypothetical protein
VTGRVITRRLAGHKVGDTVLLDVVEHVADGLRNVTLFFEGTVEPDQVSGPKGAEQVLAGDMYRNALRSISSTYGMIWFS